MRKIILWAVFAAGLCPGQAPLVVKWEELSAVDFVEAIRRSQGACLLPIGVLEKHGPHLPLGTDVINVRHASVSAAKVEYAVVFPEYYFGQIFEARQQPGTIAYSAKLQMELLQETADEMARNGCKKILIVNGHGGNNHLLPYFAQAQMASQKDYVVYVFQRGPFPPGRPPMKSTSDGHAGESETSRVLISRPDLVRMDRAGTQSGADRNRLDLPASVYTGIWWYSRFPEHYAGDGAVATAELGDFDTKALINQIAAALRAIKSDQNSLKLQNEFFEQSKKPLETRQ